MTREISSAETNGLAASWIRTEEGASPANASRPARTESCRRALTDVVAFGSPLIALVEQVQRNGTTVNEYGVDLGSYRFEAPKLVDLYGGPVAEMPGRVLIMLQQRSMAQMIERQLTHRAAARSVSGMAAVLAHEIKNPLSGIRGAAQLLEPGLKDEDRALTQLICTETDRIRDLVDRMEVFGDERPLAAEPVNIHSVLDHVKRLAETGFADGIKIKAEQPLKRSQFKVGKAKGDPTSDELILKLSLTVKMPA